MKPIQFLKTATLVLAVLLSSCAKDDDNAPDPNNPSNPTTDLVTADPITYEASGGFTFTNTETNTAKEYTHQYVKINYKDQSNLWANTQYTYLSFYNTNAQAATEMITFVILGKEMPKTGTYKVGSWPIASAGITEADKLLPDEMAILVVGNSLVTKRNTSMTIQVVNDNGKITIKTSNEIEVYDNLTGGLKGKCKDINLTRTTKKA
ncbi:hypothetical protein [Flavobacterium sp.]|uniref:hypothetical protein n=1 Tax=Flavobacterium sp. TaxID=239 RepID=UPI00262A3814|nr:hypothetical protein [Flavobacterium sp.]MDD3005325.1 hypothetical protein [Flavobacterium sp.]